MAWPKGKPRPEGAGRSKGTPNKKTQSLFDKCEEHGIDPFTALLLLSQNGEKEETRLGALKEICQYLYPKRKAIEHTGNLDLKVLDELEKMQGLSESELSELIQSEIIK